MAKCAVCDKSIVLGGLKDGDVRYCSVQCQFQSFFPKFQEALSRAADANPNPLPTTAPDSSTSVPETQPDDFASSPDGGKDLFVILVGLCACAAVAALIYWLVGLVGYPFHVQTFLLVIPIGAYLCGLVAGLGFWLALRQFDRLPTGWTYLAAGLGGVVSYVLIYFLMWWLMEIQGAKVRDAVGFSDFLQTVLEHQRVRFGRGRGEGVELGKWAYPRFAINVVGHALGVLTMVGIAGGSAYCAKCRRYLKTVCKQVRSSSDPDATGAALHAVIAGVQSGRIQEALDRHAGSAAPGDKGFWTTTFLVQTCPGCGMHKATLTASIPGEQGPQEVDGFKFEGTTDSPVHAFT